jgi:hypothetical protein
MNLLWELVWGFLPWPVWIILGVAVAAIVFRLLGWKGVVAVAATTLGVVAYSRGAKRGLEVEQAKQVDADNKARETISSNRTENAAKSDDALDSEINRWTRS